MTIKKKKPTWVKLGLASIKTRKAALGYLWFSVITFIGCIVYSVIYKNYGALVFILAPIWYQAAIRWMDKNEGW
ncbi:MAG: hypothetical protein NE330_06630 [Lentisphaeraceae bacterium]|nr:hypothetical protein [Lentisphaeraceae bacterium]